MASLYSQDTPALTLELLIEGFAACGLQAGQTVCVHASLSKLGWVVGGAETVIRALLQVVGTTGTLMMPAQTWKNLDPARGVHEDIPEAWWPVIREHWPAYDPAITPSVGMGVIAEAFRTWPGALRSSHPVRSFAALGPNAAFLTEGHDLENVFGEGSPLSKLYDLDGYILLIGVDHSRNTSLHLAESRADYAGKHLEEESSAILINGVRRWVTYKTLAVQSDDFAAIGDAYEIEHKLPQFKVGAADVRFMRQRPLIDWAIGWMERNRRAG